MNTNAIKKIKWEISGDDEDKIRLIVLRAFDYFKGHYAKIEIEMDIVATHANGCPLDLDKLYNADEFNFLHDVGGIRQHLNRETGKLEDFFVPRAAARGG